MPARYQGRRRESGRFGRHGVACFETRTRYVTPQTEQRVLLAIRKLKYYKNVHAGRLARGSSESWGDNFRYRESLFPKIIKSFEAEAVKHRFDILLCATD